MCRKQSTHFRTTKISTPGILLRKKLNLQDCIMKRCAIAQARRLVVRNHNTLHPKTPEGTLRTTKAASKSVGSASRGSTTDDARSSRATSGVLQMLPIRGVMFSVDNSSLKPGGVNSGKNTNARGSAPRLRKIAKAWAREGEVPDTMPPILLGPASERFGTPELFAKGFMLAIRDHPHVGTTAGPRAIKAGPFDAGGVAFLLTEITHQNTPKQQTRLFYFLHRHARAVTRSR